MDSRVAIICHLGNYTLWPDLKYYVDMVRSYFTHTTLYISYQRFNPLLNQLEKDYGAILIAGTLGMDIGGQLLAFEHMLASDQSFDLVFKLHTKSNYVWREDMLYPIAGNKHQLDQVTAAFRDPKVGLVGCEKWLFHVEDGVNSPKLREKATEYGFRFQPHVQQYLAGTIFWLRWSSWLEIMKTFAIDLNREYRQMEPGYIVNNVATVTHSWERLFGILLDNIGQRLVGLTISLPKVGDKDSVPKFMISRGEIRRGTMATNRPWKKIFW